MGFLLGAFGKLMAGRRVRDLQARMMRVQSKTRRVTRQIERMSKMLETQKKLELNNLTMQQSMANSMMSSFANMSAMNQLNATGNGGQDVSRVQQMMMGGMDQNSLITMMASNAQGQTQGLSTAEQAYMSYFSGYKTQASATNEAMIAQMKSQIEEKYENLNDTMLEPLKMEEDSLQTEKDSLESQIQVAQADYEACKKMEQADAKNLAPNYTGSAQ